MATKQPSGVFEEDEKDFNDNYKIDFVLQDNIAKTCLLILTSLVNQNMKVVSKNKKVEQLINKFNRRVKLKRKMDSIVYNQLAYGHSVLFYNVMTPTLKVYDTSTFDLITDPTAINEDDEFQGIYQKTTFKDPEELKQGRYYNKTVEQYIPPENLVLVPGIGKGHGESIILESYEYVKAKHEIVSSLYDLVRRLGLLTVITIDFPGDVGESDIEEYLEKIGELVENASPNSIWILPTGTAVEGVKGSGESKIIESVKTIIDLLDEEIRKSLFVPDTFLTSLSANRATAKEQRYLIASMVSHIRDLVEEAMIDVYDDLLETSGLPIDYEFSWGNINLPEPEKLVDYFISLAELNGIDTTELRSYINLGTPKKKINNKSINQQNNPLMTQGNIYDKMNGKQPQKNVPPKNNNQNVKQMGGGS